ncbi:MAG: hypothetical protein KGZ58_00780 [Ignavibacteriales bacterium]|nr:hypothetical protein [Ignavibacteriales bacterium]
MFFTLLAVNFVLAFVLCFLISRIFRNPIDSILKRLIAEEIYVSWSKYIKFAIYVVGVSGGVRVWDLEKYITPQSEKKEIIQLTNERWILEIYRTIIETMQAVAWMLLIFFIFALLAFVVVKGLEMRKHIQ